MLHHTPAPPGGTGLGGYFGICTIFCNNLLHVVISQLIRLVSQKRWTSEVGISLFIAPSSEWFWHLGQVCHTTLLPHQGVLASFLAFQHNFTRIIYIQEITISGWFFWNRTELADSLPPGGGGAWETREISHDWKTPITFRFLDKYGSQSTMHRARTNWIWGLFLPQAEH